MEKLVRLQQKIAPESLELVDRRYQILRMIFYYKPVGRRHIAEYLGLQERAVRNEIEFLRQQGFLTAGPHGDGTYCGWRGNFCGIGIPCEDFTWIFTA